MIVQPTFLIPPEIEIGLLSGDLVRYGGVVRDSAGRLVVHLKELPPPEKVVEEVVRRSLSIKNPWVVAGAGALLVVAVGGGVVLAVKNRRKSAEPEVPKCVEQYNQSLKTYLEAIGTGGLGSELIGRLIKDLDAVKEYADEGEYATVVAFSTEQLETLTNLVVDYTTRLAESNGIVLDEPQPATDGDGGNVVVDLRRYLEIQKRIFDEGA